MKIAVFNALIGLAGGGEKVALSIARAFEEAGHDVHLYTYEDESRSVDETISLLGLHRPRDIVVLKTPVIVRLLGVGGRFVRYRRLMLVKNFLDKIKNENYNLVVDTSSNAPTAVDISYIHFPASLSVGEGFRWRGYEWLVNRLLKKVVGNTRLVLTNSSWTLNLFRKVWGDNYKAEVLHPPVDVDFFSRRNSIVEVSARVFHERTGKIPVVVTGVRPPKDFLGREALEERRSFGELFVFGNFSVELGIDLRRIRCGIVHGATLGEIIQRIGRIGRGDVDEAWIGIVMPKIYVSHFSDLNEKVVSYNEFVEKLSQVIAQTLPVETCGESFIRSSSIGKIRMYLPLTSFLLYQIALWEYHEDVKKLVKKMIEMFNRLGVDDKNLEPLRKADSPEILIPLAFMRRGDYVRYVRDGVEDEASITTLLGNYDVKYENGRVVIKGVEKKPLYKLMTLTAVDASARAIREKSGRITSSKQALRDIRLEGDETLLKILRNRDIPLYITKEENNCMKVLTAFGHAIEIESQFSDMTKGGRGKIIITHLITL